MTIGLVGTWRGLLFAIGRVPFLVALLDLLLIATTNLGVDREQVECQTERYRAARVIVYVSRRARSRRATESMSKPDGTAGDRAFRPQWRPLERRWWEAGWSAGASYL